jgi:hypothetical protein
MNFSYFLATDGSAGFDVGGSWWQRLAEVCPWT